ncbi:hypothetical protein B0I35DRAFT_268318 [Stachybotrys elegans]|uniref:C2H2-type domain-containing protein n=1 Tax=Stachybotrys elegans TaxID=80388 RepID=A0A8K0SI95_9HYPO|nr:hypothetical protein B0I35DRAFT_268318 [Stachybotrys elegans]
MTTAAQRTEDHNSHQTPQSQLISAPSPYDTGEDFPHSPPMQPLRLRLEPVSSPPPEIPPAQVSFSPNPIGSRTKSNRPKIHHISGDAVLIKYLGNGTRPDVAATAAHEALDQGDGDGDDDETEEGNESDKTHSLASIDYDSVAQAPGRSMGIHQPPSTTVAKDLRNLAAGALLQTLAASSPPPSSKHQFTAEISNSAQQLSLNDEQRHAYITPAPYLSKDATRPLSDHHPNGSSPAAMLTPASGELPPLQMDSPKSESNAQSLPSIRSTFGDINRLTTEVHGPCDQDNSPRHVPGTGFVRSPSAIHRLPTIAPSHVSPPISPSDGYQRGLPSPRPTPGGGSYYYAGTGFHNRPSADYGSSIGGDTPGAEHSVPTPATSTTSTSVADRMSIDGITNPVGQYVCTVAGCNAPPFQTQYLLNSHANVHSSERPHYCRVPGCHRGEAGKGFKRKNEMIRHGLVHDSPGYVCPFCPDREHKYPRPDNLQRHVRVHHVDKNKDDPLLREVLSQRPDGPNRGRRRRGAAS